MIPVRCQKLSSPEKGKQTRISSPTLKNWRLTDLVTKLWCKGMGPITVARPKMSPVSQMIEPIALPSAMAGFPCQAERTETTISGKVVPRLTIVAPIIILGTLNQAAKPTAELTIKLALLTRIAKQKIRKMMSLGQDSVARNTVNCSSKKPPL